MQPINIKNLAVHIASITPEQSDKALGVIWWIGFGIVCLAIITFYSIK